MNSKKFNVQRLAKPLVGNGPLFSVAHALSTYGLREFYKKLDDVWALDYMGISEYDGAIPDAISKMVTTKLAPFSVTLQERDVPKPTSKEARRPARQVFPKEIFVLGDAANQREITQRILQLGNEEANRNAAERERNSVGMQNAIWPSNRSEAEIVGWLDLDNNFFFTISAQMFLRTALVFGIDKNEIDIVVGDAESPVVEPLDMTDAQPYARTEHTSTIFPAKVRAKQRATTEPALVVQTVHGPKWSFGGDWIVEGFDGVRIENRFLFDDMYIPADEREQASL